MRHRTHLHFNHACLKHQVLPKSLCSKPLINSAEGRKLTRKYVFQNLRLRIRSSHCRIKLCKSKLEELCCSLSKKLPVNVFEKIEKHLQERQDRLFKKLNVAHWKLLNKMLHGKSRKNSLPSSIEKCVINVSKTTLTGSQEKVLRLGLNFAIAPRKIPVPQILASVENSLWQVPQS